MGDQAPVHLVGDFAFMIWDAGRQTLFGARDFSGSRTLYFHRSGRQFSFCTVIHPLLTLMDGEHALHEGWISEYLAGQGRMDVADMFSTVYQGVEQLPPAHSMTVSPQGITFSRYYTFQTPSPPGCAAMASMRKRSVRCSDGPSGTGCVPTLKLVRT